MRFFLPGPCRGSKILEKLGSQKAKPGWRCFVLRLQTGLAGLIRCHRFQCGYLLWLIHVPFFGWMMPHVIGSNSLNIFLYMVLAVANCCRHSSPNIQGARSEHLGKGEEEVKKKKKSIT